MEETLTASAFAKLCGTTKATLRWYRKTGLLEPVRIGSNGYAYYASGQVVRFTIIRALQNIGCSLEQIKAYNDYGGLISTDSFLDEQVARLDQRIDELKKQRGFLDRIRNTQHELFEQWGEHPADGDWHIRHREKECYLVMSAPVVDISAYQQHLIVFQQICYEIGLGFDAPVVMFFDEKTLSKGEFAEGFCVGTKVNDPLAIQEKLTHQDTGVIEEPHLIFRVSGNYLAYLTTFPLEADADNDIDSIDFSPSSNPMIDGQNAALGIALRKGCTLEMGLLETPLTALPQKNGKTRLFLELSIAAF